MSGEITALLNAYAEGDEEAFRDLFASVYRELQHVARSQRRRFVGGQTLDTVALVNECFIRLIEGEGAVPKHREHFFAVAATAMRHLLVDYARSRGRSKRKGIRVSLDQEDVAVDQQKETVLAVHQALDKLEAREPRLVRVVECRYFAGFSVQETADCLDLSVSTVERSWRAGRAFLARELAV